MGYLRNSDAAQQRLESRFVPERIERRLDIQVNDPGMVLVHDALEQRERFGLFAKPDPDQRF
jgi:hypothetical protein